MKIIDRKIVKGVTYELKVYPDGLHTISKMETPTSRNQALKSFESAEIAKQVFNEIV